MTNDERKVRNREKTARYRARHPERVLAQGRTQSKKWHAAHREQSIATSKAYHVNHREEQCAKAKAKWANRSEEERAKDKARRIESRVDDNASRRARRAADPEAARRKEAERRARPGYRERAVARTAEWMRKHQEHARALGRKQDAKRRAIERECFVEAVDPRVVFERDKGICGICTEQVEPMSPWEMDHIIPILRGGQHSYANVQLAHRRCNRSKGAKCA